MHKNIYTYFCVFFLSGFSGLIYESIWSHYLKLFLGHAAYAQTLVLAIFMGGMAIGSWVCSVRGGRWKNLLLGYAVVEGIIGLLALLFHESFTAILHYSYESVMPAMGSQWLVSVYKWSLCTLLILPQSILLGMTFPLMSAGVIRLFPGQPGNNISMLYFTNSIGAAIGVLVSGFVLIAWVGLPGTIKLAGAINLIIAIFVWWLVRNLQINDTATAHIRSSTEPKSKFYYALLGVAFCTGLASFIYEISWIRMLSLVLGSSTHAFEIMLSAFILGLALGGLWIRNRIETIKNSVVFLGTVQIVMGCLALATLPLYNATFDVMQWIVNNLDKNDSGFFWFNLSSHAIATAVMLPTTFCAGMTLPLITFTLLKRGDGEQSIGAVYAANTVGAICGVFFAIHAGMPLLGIKLTLWLGALIDIAVGVLLFLAIRELASWRFRFAPLVIGAVALTIALALTELDVYKMGSGVYRDGSLYEQGEVNIKFHRDGKSASIDLHETSDGYVAIRTNGKVDATIQMQHAADISVDEPTMILAAALPLSINPQAQHAAVIGLGSGLSTHALLSSEHLQIVDTIEIEPAIVEAAQGFRPRVERAYTDPRGHIYIEDAKTYFSTQNKQYDIIVSVPSNPWVSGIASLFTQEFYQVVKRYLQQDGMLVQWIQLYEFNTELVATIVKALSKEFEDYVLYTPADHDLLIIARKQGKLPPLSSAVFSQPHLATELHRIGVWHLDDINARKIGGRDQLEPLFQSYSIAANSDYYPVLDLNAAKARFLNSKASELVALTYQPIPVIRALSRDYDTDRQMVSDISTPTIATFHRIASAVYQSYVYDSPLPSFVPEKYTVLRQNVLNIVEHCYTIDTGGWIDFLLELNSVSIPFLSRGQLDLFWRKLSEAACFRQLPDMQKDWLSLMVAVARFNAGEMSGIAQWLLQHNVAATPRHFGFLMSIAMLGEILNNNHSNALNLYVKYRQQSQFNDMDLTPRLLLSLASGGQ